MTCNPAWPDIKEAINMEVDAIKIQQSANFRPDIVARAFYIRVTELLNDIMKKQIFGMAIAYVGVIEFQKRGLPHFHLLVMLTRDDKKQLRENIDDFICAEIPDANENKDLFKLVDNYMVHGPCGDLNPNRTCMIGESGKKRCRFNFPKEYVYI